MKKALVISTKPPYPLLDGTAIRTFQMLEFLSEFYEIHLVYMTEKPNEEEVKKEMGTYCKEINSFTIKKRTSYWNVLKGLLLNKKPLQVNYFHFNKIQKWIDARIDNYDVVFCNNIRTAEYARKAFCTKMIDYVDALSMNYKTAINNRQGLWHYIYKIDSKRCLKYERKLLFDFDKHFIISEIDKAYILDGVNTDKDIYVIENYVSNDDKTWVKQEDRNTLAFVGTMDYEPNVTAVTYFVNNIFPALKEKFQDIVFYMIGNRPSKEILKFHDGKNIIVTGRVKSVKEYIQRASIVVIPMKSGSGIQNKVLEAMSMRGCVVTTSIGIDGMQPIHDEVIIADTDKKMINDITFLLQNKDKRIEMGLHAENYVKKYYSKDILFEKFKHYMLDCK